MEQNYFEEFEERESQKGMTVIACLPGKTAQVIEIDGSLEGMQSKIMVSSLRTFFNSFSSLSRPWNVVPVKTSLIISASGKAARMLRTWRSMFCDCVDTRQYP